MSAREARPRNWQDLRRAVLEDDYLDLEELHRRHRYATYLKRVVWLIPLVALVCGAEATTQSGISTFVMVGVLLIVAGAVVAYRLGARWEARWRGLIGDKLNA